MAGTSFHGCTGVTFNFNQISPSMATSFATVQPIQISSPHPLQINQRRDPDILDVYSVKEPEEDSSSSNNNNKSTNSAIAKPLQITLPEDETASSSSSIAIQRPLYLTLPRPESNSK